MTVKAKLSSDIHNAIVWLERRPGVRNVVQGRYTASKHHHKPGFTRVRVSRDDSVHVVVYDQKGVKDLFVYADPGPNRDKWVSLLTSGEPIDMLIEKTPRPKDAHKATTAPATATIKSTTPPREVPMPDKLLDENAGQIVNVTPELATEWLERNTRNRKLRQSVVNKYAADMKNGKWMISVDAIGFDVNGTIVNGQHRLWAILESNVTVPMLVMRNLDPDVVTVLDDHLKRNMSDVASIRRPGTTINSIHTSMANMLLQTSVLANAVDRRQALMRITRQAQLESLDKHWDAIEFVYRECFRSTKMRSITVASVLTPMARAYYSQDRNRLIQFGSAMLSGMAEDKEEDQPAILLRNFLLRFSQGVRPTADVIYRKTERALSAFLERTKLSTLYEAAHELFPLPEDGRPKGMKR